jgi:two-component system, OmpR family, phosphate regulon sensor histidine kinase PhoR
MTPKTLRYIILLMSVSLAGMIVMQVFWILNAYKVTEEQFNANVGKALNDLTSQIEAREAFSLISSDTTLPFPEKVSMAVKRSSKVGTRKLNEKEQVVIRINKNDRKDDSSHVASENTIRHQEKLPHHSTMQKQNLLNNILADTLKGVRIIIVDSVKMENKMEKIQDVIRKMVVENQSTHVPTGQRLNNIDFRNLLKTTLKQHVIDLEYEYRLTSDTATIFQTEGFEDDGSKELYRINLFPNDFISKNDYLHIHFPGRFGYLFKSLITTITVSFLFTLIIVITFVFTITSILKQKRISEIKNDFISNMTHEFKTPIATVLLASDSIATSAVQSNPVMIRELNNVIREEAIRMNQNVEQVLRFSMIDRQNNPMVTIQRFSMHKTIGQAIDRIWLQLEQRGALLSQFLEADNHVVDADKDQMLNILLNLLDNAIKYSPGRPEITIRSRNHEQWLQISITDRGIGIRGDEQKRIFDRFYRVHTGNIHNIKGFGLGLSYVREFLTAMGGTIAVESKKGDGSTFTVNIPFVKQS